MKKFSTAILPAAFALAFSLANSAQAASKCEFLSNAPDSHAVVRGDTLWGISGKFLQNPWCWPQVWGMNKEDIKNPHWIYPGQTVYFDRANGRLRLGTPAGQASSGEGGTVRLAPQIRVENVQKAAIPAIPASQIEPFLSQPLVVTPEQLADTPRIVATQEGRVNLAINDRAYVKGDLKGATQFQVFRPGVPLKDPATGEILGYEAVYLGIIKLTQASTVPNEAHSFRVETFKQEMGVGDHLLPVPPALLLNYVPHPPSQLVAGQVVSVYGGVTQAGQSQIVSINRGKKDGLDLGAVLELYRFGQTVVDRTDVKNNGIFEKSMVKLPDEKYGKLFIFRVFDGISYGLIMQVTDTVQIGDVVKSPE